MRSSRRTITWVTVLAIVIAVVVITQRREGDTQAPDRADAAQDPIDDADGQAEPEAATAPQGRRDRATAWATISRELSRDSSDASCVQLVNEAAAFAARERAAAESRNDWLVAQIDQLQRDAANLRDPADILTALLVRPPADRRWDDPSMQAMLLEFGTRAASSGHPTAAWHALRLCAEAGPACPFSHLENQLLDAQLANSEAWALVATARYQRGDSAGALAAMQGAARAVASMWYWPDTIELVERRLASNTAIPYPDRANLAFGSASAAIPLQTGLLTMCRVESAASRAWGDACLAFGNLRQENNETEMGQGLAYSIRRQALTGLGDLAGAAEVAAEYERYTAERLAGGQQLMVAGAQLQAALIDADPARLHTYLDEVRHRGEVAGRRELLRREAPALMERAGLLGREGARECVAEIFLEPHAAGATRQAILEHRLQPGDELHISLRDSVTGTRRSTAFTRRVGPDGRLALPRGQSIAAAGMTTEQFQRELAAMASGGGQPSEALVIPIPRRPREDLRSEFENARTQTGERRD